ncbi:hypothetical protein IQ249_12175 [Lusitaniella coriacea LEGE 07157]|uniref:Uncharacterized protein n=1 Tax=Lusitaniella coriacea LEGE 07157 TaxID=945747 RepID=A0A8J7DYB0_9CYAN|nr:hypothetical protein [Lusitaniella coriacea]MBE9116658.1 hypothetical protein [Lusitaniella coriacea LEGE 07157]
MTLNYMAYSIGFGILTLISFALLHWLGIPSGNFLDWVIGIASFWWLLAISTVPWNVHFDAQEVIAEAAMSQSKEIAIDDKQVQYSKRVARWSLVVAIALHLLSAIGLYTLAATGISVVGYVSSGAALLFTALRPAIRTYQYIARRLAAIRRNFLYPREDIQELRRRFSQVETTVERLDELLDPQEPHSWVATVQQDTQGIRKDIAQLRALLEQYQANNEVEHQQLSKEARNAIAQLTEDSQVLGHVREIIQFFKTA